MSLLSLRFRHLAFQLKIMQKYHPDLELDNLKKIIHDYLPKQWAKVESSRQDKGDPLTYWNLLNIDEVLSLEDIRGNFTRVGVSFHIKEHQAYSILAKAQKPAYTKVRRTLKIYRYWVFFIEGKYFPSSDEWIDILYHEIDLSTNKVGCKLIQL
jgi:hypothetical protein